MPSEPIDGYRAVWRWHFYAGLFVMPFLMLLALTGGAYLFKDEIDRAMHRSMIEIPASSASTPPDAWLAEAARAAGGRVANARMPARPDEAVRMRVDRPDGGQRAVFLDPHTGRVTGVTEQVGLTETIKQIHSLSLFGPAMNLIVEVVAGWAIILVATGFYMWWPRGRDLATFRPRLSDPGRRVFWRDLHAVTGAYVGLIIAFLAFTGMPWSAVWGDRFLNIVRESGLGRPAAPAAASPFAHAKPHDTPVGVGWTMEHAVMHGHHAADPSLARALAVAEEQGLARPFVVNIPQTPDLAWTLAHETRRAEDARSLYVDGQTGAVKADIRWDQFGAGAKAFEWGIAVHQGMQYGEVNRILMLIGCISVWVLGISGFVMWWKRRPRGRLGAPIAPPGLRARKAVLLIVLPLCVLFPLTGLSLVAALAIDRLVSLLAARRAAA